MQSVLVVTLLAVLVSPTLNLPIAADKDAESQEQQDIRRVTSEHHAIDEGNVSKRDAVYGGCTKEMHAPRGRKPVRVCNTGFARHSNGRCYRVVDKPRDGGAVAEHEYQITRGAECYVFVPERNVANMGKEQTLDLCDEDGGCDKYKRIKAVVPRRPLKGHRNN